METSVQSTGEQKVSIRLLLACGAIGPLLNTFVLLILGATRPGYNAWHVPDSNLELGWVGGYKSPTTSSLERSCSVLPSGSGCAFAQDVSMISNELVLQS